MVEYRPVPDADVAAYRRVLDYAFRAEAGPDPGTDDETADRSGPGEPRALFEDGQPVTTARHYPFTITVRGDWVPAVGLGAVATRPEARHQGHVRTIVRESLAEYRDREWPFALLWPFDHEFYRRFGWGRLGTVRRSEFDPAALGSVTDHPLAGGRFERLAPADYPALQRLDERIAETTDLTMRRTETWYRHRFFDGLDGEPYVYGWYTDDGLGGYLRYNIQQPADDRELRVSDVGAPDAVATVNLLRFINRHAAQCESVRLPGLADELLFDLVEDPRTIELELRPGPMGRLVDVQASLESLPVPTDVTANLTIAVVDDHAAWNDRRFELTVRNGSIQVAAASGAEADAELPVETLSRLAFGTITADRAALAGGLAADDAVVARLGELFPPREVALREFF